jgi:probable HAF family extracellular repeat protein
MVLAMSTTGGTVLAADATVRPATSTYRVVALSADQAVYSADINAKGQVAFTETIDGVYRARFYDGNAVRDLGTLGGPVASAAAVNDLGQVTGSASINADGSISHAYRWSRWTGMVDLGRPGQGESSGSDINNKGQVSGTVLFRPGELSSRRGFFWSPQTGMLSIGTPDVTSLGGAINDAGTIVGYSGGAASQVFRWNRTEGLRPLGTLFDEFFTLGSDINAAGHIVGASPFTPLRPAHAFLWTPREGLLDLGTGTGNRSRAAKVNDRDMVIGQVIDFGSIDHGFIWTREAGLTEIGAESPALGTAAYDLNNLGQVVGAFGQRAYVWTRGQGVVDLNTRLTGAPEGLVLQAGLAISDNGTIVARGNTGLVLLVPTAGAGNEAPVVGPIRVTGTPRIGGLVSVYAAFKDVDLHDTHKATWAWGDGHGEAGSVNARSGAGSVSGQHAYRTPGLHTIQLTVTDSSGKSTTVHHKVAVGGAARAQQTGE